MEKKRRWSDSFTENTMVERRQACKKHFSVFFLRNPDYRAYIFSLHKTAHFLIKQCICSARQKFFEKCSRTGSRINFGNVWPPFRQPSGATAASFLGSTSRLQRDLAEGLASCSRATSSQGARFRRHSDVLHATPWRRTSQRRALHAIWKLSRQRRQLDVLRALTSRSNSQ